MIEVVYVDVNHVYITEKFFIGFNQFVNKM